MILIPIQNAPHQNVSSHVLKEQSNVDSHNPDICYEELVSKTMISINNSSLNLRELLILPDNLNSSVIRSERTSDTLHASANFLSSIVQRVEQSRENSKVLFENNSMMNQNNRFNVGNREPSSDITLNTDSNISDLKQSKANRADNLIQDISSTSNLCPDLLPSFVAQSSICWYILLVGLSCYLFDLLLRKWRRSKSSIQLLNVRLDNEGNLVELVLSNNHKRFSRWMPGQFVYLNCPQIASCEWHPFTISSMDNENRQFTLHIKTGGDWTRKLRQTIEHMNKHGYHHNNNSMSSSFLSLNDGHDIKQNSTIIQMKGFAEQNNQLLQAPTLKFQSQEACGMKWSLDILPNLDCYDEKTGELQIECTKLIRILNDNNKNELSTTRATTHGNDDNDRDCVKIGLVSHNHNTPQQPHRDRPLNSSTIATVAAEHKQQLPLNSLNLFIDGPFHSPFERLLEQQVSVCIANGVGWTAFSSVFQCILNNLLWSSKDTKDWWTQWRNFAIKSSKTTLAPTTRSESQLKRFEIADKINRLSNAKLHLMVIVTSIEQLKPFYYLAINYHKKMKQQELESANCLLNPIQEITAYVTRSK